MSHNTMIPNTIAAPFNVCLFPQQTNSNPNPKYINQPSIAIMGI